MRTRSPEISPTVNVIRVSYTGSLRGHLVIRVLKHWAKAHRASRVRRVRRARRVRRVRRVRRNRRNRRVTRVRKVRRARDTCYATPPSAPRGSLRARRQMA
jgi:hypothetical protein